MLYFEMLVANNTLLNILLPNDNKVLKEALKEADSKSLEQIIKNNTGSVGDVLKDLFENLKSGTKSNSSIENILKNSTVFKEMGSFSNSLSSMLEANIRKLFKKYKRYGCQYTKNSNSKLWRFFRVKNGTKSK